MTVLAKRRSRFGLITVEEDGRGSRAYCQGNYYQSHADKNGVSLLIYTQALFALLRQARTQSLLMIGCAGGSLATMLAREGVRVTALDVNPHAFALAQRFFALPSAVECRVADGYDYLFATRRKFDCIVLDAFHGGKAPAEFLSAEFFAQAAKRLNPRGCVFANVHVVSDGDAAADRMAGAMRDVFPQVRILDRPGRRYRNALVGAGAVRALKPPELIAEPEVDAARLRKALREMRFR